MKKRKILFLDYFLICWTLVYLKPSRLQAAEMTFFKI